MAWRRPGDKPLSESLPTGFTDAYMHSALGGDELKAFRSHYSILYSEGIANNRRYKFHISCGILYISDKYRLIGASYMLIGANA